MTRAHKTALMLAILALQSTAPFASAHPGHSLDTYGPVHLMTSPYHVGLLALVAAALWCGARFVKHRLPRRVLQACSLVAVIAAAVICIA